MLKPYFSLAIRRFWMVLVPAVLLLALGGLLIRWALPEIRNYRAEIEARVSDFIGRPVTMKDVTADWHGWSPQLHFNEVELPDSAYPVSPIHFERVSVHIDLLASLLARDLRPSRISFVGPQLTARRRPDGFIHIEGTDPENDDFIRWLLKQRQAEFKAGRVVWIDEKVGHPPLTLTEVALQLRNEGDHHQLQGTARPPKGMGEGLRLALDLRGDLLTADWSGEIYAEGQDIKPAFLFDYARQLELKFHGGQGQFRLWSTWDQSKLIDVQGDFRAAAFEASIPGSLTPKALLPAAPAWAGNIPVVASSARQAGPIPGPGFPTPAAFETAAASYALHVKEVKSRFGARPTAEGGWRLDLDGFTLATSRLEFPGLFENPLSFDRVSGDIRWSQAEDGWRFHTPELTLANPDIEAKLSGGIAWSGGRAPFMDLLIQFRNGRLESFAKYVPLTLPPKAHEWLTHAFHGGLVRAGSIVFRGPLDEFPFDQHQGRFAVHVEVDGGVLEYSPQWPRIHGIDAAVDIENRALSVLADEAKILKDIDLRAITTRIPDLGSKETHVLVRGQARGQAGEGRQFVVNSPLKETVGKQIEPLDIGGEVRLELNLDIPLGAEKSTVEGKLTFPGNSLKLGKLDFALMDLGGVFRFGRDDWSGEGLTAGLFGRPVRIDLQGGEGYGWLRLQGHADRLFISERLREAGPALARWIAETNNLEHLIEGETAWQADVDLSRPWDHSEAKDNLRISSDLAGLKLGTPPPLGKSKSEIKQLLLKTTLSSSKNRSLTIGYGGLVNAKLDFAEGPTGTTLGRTVIRLGQGKVAPPGSVDFWAGGNLAEFSLSEWLDFMRTPVFTAPSPITAASPRRTQVDIQFSRMEAFGYAFNDLHLKADNQTQRWLINLGGPETAGLIQIHQDKPPLVIGAELERLKLVPASGKKGPFHMDPGEIPALSIHCSRLLVESVDLGEATLKTQPIAHRLQMDKASFASPDFRVDASGHWELTRRAHRSRFDINVEGADLRKLLERFGYNATAMERGKTKMQIQAGWPGTPADFTLASLQGSLKLHVTDGRLTEVENRIGRIFGLLSIQTLPRRLALDFSDLFKKGFTFDSIEGAFTLENGNAYTNDLTMRGPSARIDVTGRTGLVNQDYDQVVTVTPALASTLPIASALFGPVGAGVGATILLAEQVFTSLPEHLDNMLSRRYTVTGPWDAPVIK